MIDGPAATTHTVISHYGYTANLLDFHTVTSAKKKSYEMALSWADCICTW